jgi:hypothetical protein
MPGAGGATRAAPSARLVYVVPREVLVAALATRRVDRDHVAGRRLSPPAKIHTRGYVRMAGSVTLGTVRVTKVRVVRARYLRVVGP